MEHIVLKSKDNISYDVDMAQVKYLRMINELVRDFEGSGEREVIELPLSSIQIQKVLTFLRRHQSEMDHLPTSISDELPYLQKEMNFMKPDDSKTDLDLEERLNVSQQDRELFGNFFETTEVIKAADYLDFPQLRVASIRWAAIIVSVSDAEQIYELFGVRPPTDAEEEAAVAAIAARRHSGMDLTDGLIEYLNENHLKLRTLLY